MTQIATYLKLINDKLFESKVYVKEPVSMDVEVNFSRISK